MGKQEFETRLLYAIGCGIKHVRSTSVPSCTFVPLSALCRRSPRRPMHVDTLIVVDKEVYGTYIHNHGDYH